MDECVSITDVYDSAAVIGKDFERIVENCGADAVSHLMPEVIRILEQLEFLAAHHERENSEITHLQMAVTALEKEKKDKQHESEVYHQELECIEETWHNESKNHLKTLSKLQEDNHRLQSLVSHQVSGQAESSKSHEDQMQLLAALNSTATEQRRQLRELERERKERLISIDAAELQAKELIEDNAKHRLLLESSTAHACCLEEEKRHLEVAVKDRTSAAADEQVSGVPSVVEDEVATTLSPAIQDGRPPSLAVPAAPPATQGNSAVAQTKSPTCPMRSEPRFTASELRVILMERNQLKARLNQVREELAVLKSKEASLIGKSQSTDEVDAPVQGPINREPWEKLHPNNVKSSIRKFFNMLGVSAEDSEKNSDGISVSEFFT